MKKDVLRRSVLKIADFKLPYEPRLKLRDRLESEKKGLGFSWLFELAEGLASEISHIRGYLNYHKFYHE